MPDTYENTSFEALPAERQEIIKNFVNDMRWRLCPKKVLLNIRVIVF